MESEESLSSGFDEQLPDHCVLMVDRGLIDDRRFDRHQQRGEERRWLVRAKSNLVWTVLEILGLNEVIAEVPFRRPARRSDPTLPSSLRIRVICDQLPGFEPQWLLTSMLDAERSPAAELTLLYHQRWELETGVDELHTHTLERLEALRSQAPDRIRQELFALAVVDNLVRLEMARVADQLEISPVRISYRISSRLIRTVWLSAWVVAAGRLPQSLEQLTGDIALLVLPARRPRSYPRAVNIKMTRSPRKVRASDPLPGSRHRCISPITGVQQSGTTGHADQSREGSMINETQNNSDLQSVLALAGPLLPNTLVYLTGSHMFGLQTPESDEDYTAIYFDPEDDRRVFRRHPVLHSDINDQKLYSLRKWAELLAKGNPNICEMVNLAHMPLGEDDGTRFLTRNRFSIRRLFMVVYPLVATQALAAAYVGHLQGLMKELAVGKYDARRTAHGYRVAYSARHLFETGILPDFRDLHEAREVVLSIKQRKTTAVWATAELKMLVASLGPVYARVKADLPATEPLREAINQFFVEVHR